MVKIKNVFGDEYKGKQKHAVYQRRYGKQIRRIKEDKKKNTAPAQREQQRRFRVGVAFYKSLSLEEKQALKEWLNERGITLTPQQYIIKTALDRGRATKETFTVEVTGGLEVEGWDAEGWLYRQWITITNNSSYDLIDYQVRLDLDSTKVGDHFDWSRQGADLRFYDEAGNKLSYYVESWDEVNKKAVVWVKVGLIKANSSITIYMYYGNTAAQSESDGNAVFEFFDDFEGTSLDTNKWMVNYAGNISYEVVNSNLRILDGYKQSKEFWIYNNTDSGNQIKANVNLTDKYIVEWKQKMETQTSAKQMGEVGLGLAKADKAFEVYNAQCDDRAAIIVYRVGGDSFIGESTLSVKDIAADTYYIMSITKNGTSYTLEVKNLSGSTIATMTSTSTETISYLAIGVGAYGPYAFSKMQIDWVRVRKYAAQEPTFTVGAEEHGLVEGYTTIQVEHIIIEHSGMQNVYIIDDTGAVIKEYTNLSSIKDGQIATRIDFINKSGKTVREVIITSVAGTINKVRL